ncbi:hypothetical protein DFJ63DRAFT_310393 [Scheffersomyces coipomensis]|uniref:uncharacterized protein n=1 Tax=Scheffersomyces coipomensis TaxID=1788519 RepID=UPI00315D9D09
MSFVPQVGSAYTIISRYFNFLNKDNLNLSSSINFDHNKMVGRIHGTSVVKKLISIRSHISLFDFEQLQIQGNLSEWLRRKIRNLLGFARAGSSPAVVVIFLNFQMSIVHILQFCSFVRTNIFS